jgi:hypothetical protein
MFVAIAWQPAAKLVWQRCRCCPPALESPAGDNQLQVQLLGCNAGYACVWCRAMHLLAAEVQ